MRNSTKTTTYFRNMAKDSRFQGKCQTNRSSVLFIKKINLRGLHASNIKGKRLRKGWK